MSCEEENDLYSEVFAHREDKVDPEVIKNLKQEIEKLQLEKNDLSKQIDQLSNVNATVLKENKTLKTNITSLFKTAQNEIERKTRMIDQLRLDSTGKSRPCDNGISSSLQQKKNNPESTSNSPSQHKQNIESHRHDRYSRDKYSDRYNDTRQDRYQSPSRYSDSRSNRSSKYSSNSYQQSDRRSSNTRVRSGTESSNVDQHSKHKELGTKISVDRSQSTSEQLDSKSCNPSTNLNVSTNKQNLSSPKPPVSSQMNSETPPIATHINSTNPSISPQINVPNPPISPQINIPNPPINKQINLSNPSVPKEIDLQNTPVSPKINLPISKVPPQKWLSKHEPLKKSLPKPPVKVVAHGPRTLFNRRLEVKINKESKTLYQQALAKFKIESCTPPSKNTSNSKLIPIQTSPTQKILNSDKTAVPAQISPTPCISLIDKIKEIEQSVCLKKIERPNVSEPLQSPIPSVKCNKNLVVKKPSPPEQRTKESMLCNKINENLTSSANIFLQKGPQNKKNSVCKNSKAPQHSQSTSIFEPEVQIHCESSCESNFSEKIASSTKTTKSKACVNNNTPKNSKVRAKKGSLLEQKTPSSQIKSRPTGKPLNPSISPSKSPLATVDFIPVYNLKSPKKQREELSLPNVINKCKTGGSRPCLKLGEVSIKVSTPGKSPHKTTKQSPQKASITKVLRVESKSSSEVDQCKSQNNQNEANCSSLQSPSPAVIDEDSQDIIVTNRKRKFVIYDSDEEILLPAAKKPASRKGNKQKQFAPVKKICNKVEDIAPNTETNINVKSSEMNTSEAKTPSENTAAIEKSTISLKNAEISTPLEKSILEHALTSKHAKSTVHQISRSNPETSVKDNNVYENNQLMCSTQLTPIDLSENKQTLKAPCSDQNQLNISEEVANTTLESSVCSENDVAQKRDVEGNSSINSDRGNNSLTKSRKENRFSALSRKRPARLVRAVVKTITVTSPEKVETIHVSNKDDKAPNRTSLDIKPDPAAVSIEDEQNCTKNSLNPRAENVPLSHDFVISVDNTLSTLPSSQQGSKSKNTTSVKCSQNFETGQCVTPEVPSLHQDIAKDLNILNEVTNCIIKVTGKESCSSLVNTLPSGSSRSQELLKSSRDSGEQIEDHTVSSSSPPGDVDMITPGRKRKTSYGKIDVQEKSNLEQNQKETFEPVLQNEESTLDANDLVGRVLRDCTKPINNLNVSTTSEPRDDHETEDVCTNVNSEIEIKISTPTNMKHCNESFDSKEKSTTPVRKVGIHSLQVQSPRKFEELETVSDSKWKATNASLKNESFNYSGRKPKKRISLYVKPSTCKSPGKLSPGSKALKTKSPLKKELAQAITTSYKVSSFRDIISTQPIQKSEKINVLTPRKSPNQANLLRKTNDSNESNNGTDSSVANVKVHETMTKPRDSGRNQKQSFLQRDIKMKLKAINSTEKTKNQTLQSNNTNVHNKTSTLFAADQKNINPVITSCKSELHNQAKTSTKPHFLIPEVLEDNARFVSISTKTSTITATYSTLPSDQMIKTTLYSQSKRCTSFESNSSSSLSLFNSIHSDIQFRNEHTISPFQDAYKLMNETPFKQLMTGTFSCVSPMAETPYKVEQTPRKITPETSQDKPDHVEDINIMYPDLKTPLKPINTSSCSSTDIHNLQDELALTPDGNSKISGCSSENPNEINDLRCHVESMDRDIAIRPSSTQHKGILPISTNQASAKVSETRDTSTVLVQSLISTEKNSTIKTNLLDTKEHSANIQKNNSPKSNLELEEKRTAKQNSDNTKELKMQESIPSQLSDKEIHSNLKNNKIITSWGVKNTETIIPRTENQTINNDFKNSNSDSTSPQIKVKSVLSQSSSKDQNSSQNRISDQGNDSFQNLNESPNRHTQLTTTSPKKIRFQEDNKQHKDNRIDENQCKSIDDKPFQAESTRYNDRSLYCRQRKRRRTPSPRCSDKSTRYDSDERYIEQYPSSDKIYKNRYSSHIEKNKSRSNERHRQFSPERRPRYSHSNERQKNTSSERRQVDSSLEVRTRNRSSNRNQIDTSPKKSRRDASPDLKHRNSSPNRNRRDTSPDRIRTDPSPNSSRRDKSPTNTSPNTSGKDKSPNRIRTDPNPNPSHNSNRRYRNQPDPSSNINKNDSSPNKNHRGSSSNKSERDTSPDVRQRQPSPNRRQKDSSPRKSRRDPSPDIRERDSQPEMRFKQKTWRNERNRNRMSSPNEKSREKDKSRRRGADRDRSVERSRNYRPSPERSRYRDKSRGRPREYRARTPERSKRRQENPKQVRETPVKKVIVKEILYYTETRSDSEDDRDRYEPRQKRHSPSPVREHRNETNRPRLNTTYDSRSRRTSDSESINRSCNESNVRSRDHKESNPKENYKNDKNLHRQGGNARLRPENIAGPSETKTGSSIQTSASKNNTNNLKTVEGNNTTKASPINSKHDSSHPIEISINHSHSAITQAVSGKTGNAGICSSSKDLATLDPSNNLVCSEEEEGLCTSSSNDSIEANR